MGEQAPTTSAAFWALPEDSPFEERVIPYTAEDIARGYAEVEGRQVPVLGRAMVQPVMKPGGWIPFDDNVVLMGVDAEGQGWRLGRQDDGSWYRERRRLP